MSFIELDYSSQLQLGGENMTRKSMPEKLQLWMEKTSGKPLFPNNKGVPNPCEWEYRSARAQHWSYIPCHVQQAQR